MAFVIAVTAVSLAGCGQNQATSSGAGVGTTARSAPGTTFNDLARAVQERATTISSTRIDASVTYPAGVTCRSWGAERSELLVSSDGRMGWVDVNADGTVDAWRDGDRVVVAASLVPDWGVPTGWISVPASTADPVTKLALLSGPLKSALSPLVSPTTPGDTIRGLEATMGPARADGSELVGERSTTRYVFSPANAHGVSARVWIDDDHALVRMEAVNTQDPYGSSGGRVDVVAIDEPVTVDLPGDSDVTPLSRLPAGPILVSQASADPACNPPEAGSAIQTRRTCINQAAKGQALEAYVQDQHNMDPLQPYGCPTG